MPGEFPMGYQPKNKAEEKRLDKQIDKHFRSHPELVCGRNFRMNITQHDTPESRDNYRDGYETAFGHL